MSSRVFFFIEESKLTLPIWTTIVLEMEQELEEIIIKRSKLEHKKVHHFGGHKELENSIRKERDMN